jgi:flagellar hook-basal body complex protein FliE
MPNISEISSVSLAPFDRPESQPTSGPSFADTLTNAVASVDHLQTAADQQATALAEGAGNLHETSIALSKAEVGMHFMMQVRNKVVAAYEDIMKMSI